MNWIKQNTFLTVYFAVLAVGALGLGYMVYSASGAYADAKDKYTAASGELTRLQNLKPSADDANLKTLVARKKDIAASLAAFQGTLVKLNAPSEDMTPEKFSDKVNALKTMVAEKSAGITEFTEKDKAMTMGFGEYSSQPPKKEALPALTQEFKVIEWLTQQLLAAQPTKVTELKRDPLPEEKAGGPSGGGGGPGGGGPGGGGGGAAAAAKRALMTVRTLDLSFQCRQESLGKFLNSLVNPSAPYFIIIRSLNIQNQKQTGPEKKEDPLPGTPDAGGKDDIPKYILGEEEVDVKLRLEIVNFAEPASTPTAK